MKFLQKKLLKIKQKPQNIDITEIFDNYEKNLFLFKEIFQNDDTIVFHELIAPSSDDIRICVIYASGMADQKEINKNIIGAILDSPKTNVNNKNFIHVLKKQIIRFGNDKEVSDVDKMVGCVLCGDTLILVEDHSTALIIDSKGYESRNISEPISENVVRSGDKWINIDTAYVITTDNKYLNYESNINNLYAVGIYNGNSNYHFSKIIY